MADEYIKTNNLWMSIKLIRLLRKKEKNILCIPKSSITISCCLRIFSILIFTKKEVYLLPVYKREISSVMKILVKLSKVRLIVLSQESYDYYKSKIKNSVYYIKTGVDTSIYSPVEYEKKVRLRKKYNISINDIVLLHVGHMVEARNIRKLTEINPSIHIILIISTSTRWDDNLYHDLLRHSNITIIHKYIEHINEFYQLSDIYYFPVTNLGCIDVPLSVLEAASCNIPILTTRFGELMTINETPGFEFIQDFDKVNGQIERLVNKGELNNRQIALNYDWQLSVQIIKKIVEG
jgi:glycosyltransferase involved in cell wall biosynthesis